MSNQDEDQRSEEGGGGGAVSVTPSQQIKMKRNMSMTRWIGGAIEIDSWRMVERRKEGKRGKGIRGCLRSGTKVRGQGGKMKRGRGEQGRERSMNESSEDSGVEEDEPAAI